MMVVGLTGGIGSGKSTVAGFFHALGIPIYIADDAAKKIQETSKKTKQEIVDLLGEQSYRGNFPNRPYIASRVFNDAKLLESLNKIVHPKVREDFKNWQQCQTAPYCLYEAAILFEHGGEAACDHTILVTAPKEIRVQRLLNRDHSDRREIEVRMAAQWSDDKKMALADFVIENLLLNETEKKVSELHDKLLQMATA